ncbi:MAG: hypothetical protein OXG09_02995 [Chloroflexi bacterium]|nr:hypothetical protein [Chloroflexota bacterium]
MSEAESQTYPDIVEHLKMIQNVIDRLARNSFWLRGWNATLAVGWLAFVTRVGATEAPLAYLIPVPFALLFLLDGYYLWQERLFRRLYDHTRQQENADFSMSTAPFRASETYLAAVFSRTTLLFHGALGVLLVLILLTR